MQKLHFQSRFDSGDGARLDAELERLGQDVMRSSSCERTPLSESEVYMRGRSSKAVGPDGVPQEILKILAQSDRGLKELTRFSEGIFAGRCPPSEWQQSMVSLLAKVECPTNPSQLRPLLLTSHIGKTFSRIIVTRLAQYLAPSGPEQCCAPGKQTADVLFTLQRDCQNSLEWNKSVCIQKLDLARAFDSVCRRSLAASLALEIGRHMPCETDALIQMLREGSTYFETI